MMLSCLFAVCLFEIIIKKQPLGFAPPRDNGSFMESLDGLFEPRDLIIR